MTFNQSKYANDYAKNNYDRLNIQVPKGQKAIIEAYRKEKGYNSLNAYVNELIRRDMEGETGKSSKTVNIGRDNTGTIKL